MLRGRSQVVAKYYQGQLDHGKTFLNELVTLRRANDEAGVGHDGIDTDLLEKAFDRPPNKLSVRALEWFILEKCMRQGLGRSTAVGIQSAFTQYWSAMDGDLYAGQYEYDEETDTVTGCPARSPSIRSLIKTIFELDERDRAAQRLVARSKYFMLYFMSKLREFEEAAEASRGTDESLEDDAGIA
ncbi:hypothetical protein Hypma_014489 [Hypsizygus marmoreus]|uniref:Uncharacterized protein n=1 Tax=Hypsizygus marmoreus TaxID=39966 RepID=A0A369JGP3_HYPMA|nr:hypothetical protein Hypma_014489 [Hypsizygus marmoreus]